MKSRARRERHITTFSTDIQQDASKSGKRQLLAVSMKYKSFHRTEVGFHARREQFITTFFICITINDSKANGWKHSYNISNILKNVLRKQGGTMHTKNGLLQLFPHIYQQVKKKKKLRVSFSQDQTDTKMTSGNKQGYSARREQFFATFSTCIIIGYKNN